MADDPPLFRFTSEQGPEFEPYQKLIGRLALAWAEFEFNLNDAIWELANVERMTGTCMTSQLIGPGPRYRCLVALLRLRNTPQDIIDKINSLSSDANHLVGNAIAFSMILWLWIQQQKSYSEWRLQQIVKFATD